MSRLQFALIVACGGALGAVLRWWLSEWLIQGFGRPAFMATLAVNVLGSLALGFLMGLIDQQLVSTALRGLLAVGLLGAFTTYSTYSIDALRLLEAGAPLAALAYVAGTAVICIFAAWSGLLAARFLL